MPYYIKDPKRDHNFDNHPCNVQCTYHLPTNDNCNKKSKKTILTMSIAISSPTKPTEFLRPGTAINKNTIDGIMIRALGLGFGDSGFFNKPSARNEVHSQFSA